MNPLDFSGKTILITGVSSGIGQATSVYLSRLGARIIGVARNRDRLESMLSSLEGTGHRVFSFDLAAVERIPDWIHTTARECGPIYGLVHSAGIIFTEPMRGFRYDHFTAMRLINLDAAIMLCKGFRHRMVREESGGSIVFVSSLTGVKGFAGLVGYGATKGALVAATRSLALELASEKVRVNCVCPGLVRTEMIGGLDSVMDQDQKDEVVASYPLGLGLPDDVAYAVAFLLAPAARWITGTAILLDGGRSA